MCSLKANTQPASLPACLLGCKQSMLLLLALHALHALPTFMLCCCCCQHWYCHCFYSYYWIHPYLTHLLVQYGVFLFFGGFQFLALLYCIFLQPETRGIPIEEAANVVRAHWFWRRVAYPGTAQLSRHCNVRLCAC